MECDASGDSVDLVAAVLRGKRFRDLPDDGRDAVRDWTLRYIIGPSAPVFQPHTASAAEPPPTPPQYPPQDEVLALWRRCSAVDCEEATSSYLISRDSDPVAVANRDLARALPPSPNFAWARLWNESYRIVVPMFDSCGQMRSLLARSIDPNRTPKSLAPSGFARSGLIMADEPARVLLSSGGLPKWWSPTIEPRVIIAEGEIDFLLWATRSEPGNYAPSVFGIVSGSWTGEIAARVPDASTVVIATDNDSAGDRYAERIVQSFGERRLRLERWESGNG